MHLTNDLTIVHSTQISGVCTCEPARNNKQLAALPNNLFIGLYILRENKPDGQKRHLFLIFAMGHLQVTADLLQHCRAVLLNDSLSLWYRS